jgi:hypothetical protein
LPKFLALSFRTYSSAFWFLKHQLKKVVHSLSRDFTHKDGYKHHVKINKDGILLIPGHISSSIGRLKYT